MSGPVEFAGSLIGTGLRFGIVVSRFHSRLSELLLSGAVDTLVRHGVAATDLAVVRVPGAWEIPFALRTLSRRGGFDALLALGVLIRGETSHFDHLARATASGLMEVSRAVDRPVAFGVLTCDDPSQAEERAGGKAGNKGAEAALAALEMADLTRRLLAER